MNVSFDRTIWIYPRKKAKWLLQTHHDIHDLKSMKQNTTQIRPKESFQMNWLYLTLSLHMFNLLPHPHMLHVWFILEEKNNCLMAIQLSVLSLVKHVITEIPAKVDVCVNSCQQICTGECKFEKALKGIKLLSSRKKSREWSRVCNESAL